jgi:hypothetical protein
VDTAALVLIAHVAATWAMVGLIWFVQAVHYPLFALVGSGGFVQYEAAHRLRTSLVVGPPMVVEAVTALWLVLAPPVGLGRFLPAVGLALVGVVWGSTVVLQVPEHDRLSERFDTGAVRRLVVSNWVRTAAWSARGALTLVMLAELV